LVIAKRVRASFLLGVLCPFALSACSQTAGGFSATSLTEGFSHRLSSLRPGYSSKDKQCLERAMYFESNRSSRDGLIAVGSVVMNRLKSGQHGDTICEVVGEKGQFAAGVLTKPMKPMEDVEEAASAVLKGERHPNVKEAMYFHTAGRKFPYKNMHYVAVAGGNAFYEKRSRRGQILTLAPEFQVASAKPDTRVAAVKPEKIKVASARQKTRSAVASAEPTAEEPVSVSAGSLEARMAPNAPDKARMAPDVSAKGTMSFTGLNDSDAIGALIDRQNNPIGQ
jgi:hypothetical protein